VGSLTDSGSECSMCVGGSTVAVSSHCC
jgi:hypothetical protein